MNSSPGEVIRLSGVKTFEGKLDDNKDSRRSFDFIDLAKEENCFLCPALL